MGSLSGFISRVGEHVVGISTSPLWIAIVLAAAWNVYGQVKRDNRPAKDISTGLISALVLTWIGFELFFFLFPIPIGPLSAANGECTELLLFLTALYVGQGPLFHAKRMASLVAFTVYFFVATYGLFYLIGALGVAAEFQGALAATFALLGWLAIAVARDRRDPVPARGDGQTLSGQGSSPA